MLTSNIPYYEEYNAVDTLLESIKGTNHLNDNDVNIKALFTLAHLVDDKKNDLILLDSKSIELLIKYLAQSLNQHDHYSVGYPADKIAEVLGRIAVNNRNVLLCKCGSVQVLLQCYRKL